MEIGYCDSTTDRDELHLPEKVPGIEYSCDNDSGLTEQKNRAAPCNMASQYACEVELEFSWTFFNLNVRMF
eukprot:gene15977-17587_t